MTSMSQKEKTWVFWFGLIILALASIAFFWIIWSILLYPSWLFGVGYWKSLVPPIVGAVVFIILGYYMMKSGVKKDNSKQTQMPTQQ